ncbi:uncharacterized protein LOC142977993 [Anticarsia gemmatalis]|uniref:uncharacterized protein LOC142977993 n=1 Tax=Anticarsia gemmatalis TaxID=129554 RepID=UPI003F773DC1
MELILILGLLYFFVAVDCFSNSESVESNRIETTPLYDTIIYSDIADIINDFENNGISPFDVFANSESQSDEKVEELLTEYQHYLEKAHKQRKNYIEKSKTKNKIPLMRHDQFSKTKPGVEFKRNDYYYSNGFYNPASHTFPQASFGNPLDVFIPVNAKGKYMNKLDMTTSLPKGIQGLLPFEKIIFNNNKILDLPPIVHKPSYEPIKSSCYCKNGHTPCECNCKQCLVHIEPFSREQQMKLNPEQSKKSTYQHSSFYESPVKKYDQIVDDKTKEFSENTLNIRVKVDLQLPKFHDQSEKYYKPHNRERTFEPEDLISKELTTAIKLPFPYFNFPVPMELFGYKKLSKYNKEDSSPVHKITIHKKKKSRMNNSNKKHRKKFITFHNIKLDQQPLTPIHLDDNVTESIKSNNIVTNNTTTQPKDFLQIENNTTLNKSDDILNNSQTEENIYLMVNISNNASNTTGDGHKFENSIETDFTKIISNVTTTIVPIIREKREVSNSVATAKINISKEKNNAKKSDKVLLSDTELLYWPTGVSRNVTFSNKNITTIILESEHNKTKFNLSMETIRQNHTRALEQAIFGEVDWDDIDAVAPAFMSFVGKYVRGILTFCSQQVCHSMKCANKTCLHRVCAPSDRLNNKGHCAGSSKTDSVASMESIMDLPSNIAFEIVDILQNKMLGKVFGKATFCINSKCITLVASKKTFVKSRCTIKELNTTGHCSNVKTVKIM